MISSFHLFFWSFLYPSVLSMSSVLRTFFVSTDGQITCKGDAGGIYWIHLRFLFSYSSAFLFNLHISVQGRRRGLVDAYLNDTHVLNDDELDGQCLLIHDYPLDK